MQFGGSSGSAGGGVPQYPVAGGPPFNGQAINEHDMQVQGYDEVTPHVASRSFAAPQYGAAERFGQGQQRGRDRDQDANQTMPLLPVNPTSQPSSSSSSGASQVRANPG